MNIYENNKQLLTTMGGDGANLATDFEVRKSILDALGGDSSKCYSIYDVDLQILKIYEEGGGGTGGDITLKPITITENGVYNAGVGNGYNTVTVEVPEISLTDITITENGVYNAGVGNGYNEVTVNVPETPLTSINITQNGVYTPEEGGYNEVTVNVPGVGTKVKVKTLTVGNDCIVDGYWPAETIDTSLMTTIDRIFYNCISLQHLDVSGWNTDNITGMFAVFYSCRNLTQIDLSGWYAGNVTNINSFSNTAGIINYVGGRTIDEVISNNITILNGLNISGSSIMTSYAGIGADRASLRALINGLADRTGQTTLNLSLGSILTAKLTEEDIAVATAKNWTIS